MLEQFALYMLCPKINVDLSAVSTGSCFRLLMYFTCAFLIIVLSQTTIALLDLKEENVKKTFPSYNQISLIVYVHR